MIVAEIERVFQCFSCHSEVPGSGLCLHADAVAAAQKLRQLQMVQHTDGQAVAVSAPFHLMGNELKNNEKLIKY